MDGVTRTVVGYTGGQKQKPTYESVCAGDGHTEAIQVEFEPSKVSYDQLLDIFFKTHTPHAGKAQYKSAIWYHDDAQKQEAEAKCKKAGRSGAAVDLQPAATWWDAEDYHQKYYDKQMGGRRRFF